MFIFHLKCDFFFCFFHFFQFKYSLLALRFFLNTHWMVFSCFGLFDEKIFFHYISSSFTFLLLFFMSKPHECFMQLFFLYERNLRERRTSRLDSVHPILLFFGKCLFYELINIFAFILFGYHSAIMLFVTLSTCSFCL